MTRAALVAACVCVYALVERWAVPRVIDWRLGEGAWSRLMSDCEH